MCFHDDMPISQQIHFLVSISFINCLFYFMKWHAIKNVTGKVRSHRKSYRQSMKWNDASFYPFFLCILDVLCDSLSRVMTLLDVLSCHVLINSSKCDFSLKYILFVYFGVGFGRIFFFCYAMINMNCVVNIKARWYK